MFQIPIHLLNCCLFASKRNSVKTGQFHIPVLYLLHEKLFAAQHKKRFMALRSCFI
jgi:hypothetical protein